MVDEVQPYRAMFVRREGDLQLGTDTVRACHENRLVHPAELGSEQPAEGPDIGQHAVSEGALGQPLDPVDHVVASIDVDARGLVVHLILELEDTRGRGGDGSLARALGRPVVRVPQPHVEAFLGDVLVKHVERVAQ